MAYSQFSNPFGLTLTPWVKRLMIANGVVFLFTWAFGIQEWLVFVPAGRAVRPSVPLPR